MRRPPPSLHQVRTMQVLGTGQSVSSLVVVCMGDVCDMLVGVVVGVGLVDCAAAISALRLYNFGPVILLKNIKAPLFGKFHLM